MKTSYIIPLLLFLNHCTYNVPNKNTVTTSQTNGKIEAIYIEEELSNAEIPLSDSIHLLFMHNLSGAHIVVWQDHSKIFDDCIMPLHYGALAHSLILKRSDSLKVAIHYNDSLLSYYDKNYLRHYRDTLLIGGKTSNHILIDDNGINRIITLRRNSIVLND